MLGRKKTEEVPTITQPPTLIEGAGAATGKGRPTPKRRDSEAANRRPLISGNPKADKAKARAAATIQRQQMNEAMETGDERYLPAQHKGSARRYSRDFIDARWTLGEFFLPLALLVVLIMMGASALRLPPEIAIYSILGLYVLVLVAVVEAIVLAARVHKRAVAAFGREHVRGLRLYTGMRSMQLRRMRMPKPQVRRGEHPADPA